MKTLSILLIFLLLPLSVSATSAEDEEVLEYTDLHINKALSLYAGKINMDYFDDSDAYSIGLILQEDLSSGVQFALGYTQPASNFNFLSEVDTEKLNIKNDDGVLFFMSYNF